MIAIKFVPYKPGKPKKRKRPSRQQLGWMAEQLNKKSKEEK